MADNPFRLTVFDKAFNRLGWVGDPITVAAVPTHNDQPTMTVTVAADNQKLPLLLEPGARLLCHYQDEYLIGGMVRATGAKGPRLAGTVDFTVVDDYRLFTRVLGWPVPASPISNQAGAEYHVVTGPAETVVKTLVTANAINRLGLPVTVAPDQGRGQTISVSLRFHPLADRIMAAVDAAGIGVTVRQDGAGLLVDCYEPRIYPRPLSEAGGTVTDWEWTASAPEATDVVVGGQGEGTARQFQAFTATDGRAAQWGDRVEVFRDARDTDDANAYTARATETFAETAARAGLKVTLSETAHFRYGGAGVRVGDRVTLQVGPSLSVTDVLRSAQLHYTRADGVQVEPVVGDIDTPDEVFARALRRTAAAVRSLRSR